MQSSEPVKRAGVEIYGAAKADLGAGCPAEKGVLMPKISDMDDIKSWIAEHDGRIGAWWEAQRRWNDENDRVHREIVEMMHEGRERIRALERRVLYATGFASAAGAGVALFAKHLFGG